MRDSSETVLIMEEDQNYRKIEEEWDLSESSDEWVWDVEKKKNTLGEWSDSDDNWIWDV